MQSCDRERHTPSLYSEFGPLIGNEDLMKVLGFKTMFALRAAINRNAVEVETFKINGRKGHFALTGDVQKWLAALKTK